MEEYSKKCCNCGCFSMYYTKGFADFYPRDVGLCRIGSDFVSKNDCCEKWRSGLESQDLLAQKALIVIPIMHNKLNAIEQTLEIFLKLEKINNKNK